jgi:hypothetical protein
MELYHMNYEKDNVSPFILILFLNLLIYFSWEDKLSFNKTGYQLNTKYLNKHQESERIKGKIDSTT